MRQRLAPSEARMASSFLAAGGTGEHQPGDIGAGDEKDKSHRRHHYGQRLGNAESVNEVILEAAHRSAPASRRSGGNPPPTVPPARLASALAWASVIPGASRAKTTIQRVRRAAGAASAAVSVSGAHSCDGKPMSRKSAPMTPTTE